MNKTIFFDGGTGTELQKHGITDNPATVNITHPQIITEIHSAYVQAGANIITANTFGAYSHKIDNFAQVITRAMENARAATHEKCLVTLDMGPTGLTLEPYGDTPAETAAEIFAATISHGVKNGADIILIETMMDLNELEIAVTAAKATKLPVYATMSFDPTGRTMYGANIKNMVELLTRLKVDAMGINCGQGLDGYKTIIADLLRLTDLPVIVQPNAGLPEMVNGAATYTLPPQDFAAFMADISNMGVKILGGCCGTTPAHIAAMVEKIQ